MYLQTTADAYVVVDVTASSDPDSESALHVTTKSVTQVSGRRLDSTDLRPTCDVATLPRPTLTP